MTKKILIVIISLAISISLGMAGVALASTYEGSLDTGPGTGPDGVVKVAPTASPAAGEYHATQSVSLTATDSSAICYTTDGTTPACASSTTCTTGTVYNSAISVTLTTTVKSVACYADEASSYDGPAASDTYTLTCTISSVANGTVAAYPGCAITCNAGYALSGSSCFTSGGGGGGGGGTTPPQISDIVVAPDSNSAVITWTTDRTATSKIQYGLTTSYGDEVSSVLYTTSHSLSLIGLSASTTYHYKIYAIDKSNVTGYYSDKNFTTLKGETEPVTGGGTVTGDAGGSGTAISAGGGTAGAVFPAGAISGEAELVITPIGSSDAIVGSPPTGSFMIGGYVYEFSMISDGEEITSFDEEITITMTYTDDQISGIDESTLQIYYWDEDISEWVALETTIDTTTNTATATTTHFSYFTLIGEQTEEEEEEEEKDVEDMTPAELEARIKEILTLIAILRLKIAELTGGLDAIPASFSFEIDLEKEMTGNDVKYLQIVLNSDTATQVASSGVGSPGNETNYFGSLTKAAVIKFQEKYSADILESWGFSAGTGYVGTTTRAKLNGLLGK